MSDILNQNMNDIGIEASGLKDVGLSLYGISVPEEEMPVEDVPPGPGTGQGQAGVVPKFLGTESQLYRMTTDTYLDGFTIDTPIDPEQITADILGLLARGIKAENSARTNDMKIKIPIGLPPETVAHVLLRLYPIVKLSLTTRGDQDDREKMPLAMYMECGPDAGLYVTDEDAIGKLARKYNYRFRSKEIKDVLYQMSLEAPTRYLTDDRDLIAVNNGIFDYRTKALLPFSPERVFISKSRVDYNPSARNPVIRNDDGTDWDVESWIVVLERSGGRPGLVRGGAGRRRRRGEGGPRAGAVRGQNVRIFYALRRPRTTNSTRSSLISRTSWCTTRTISGAKPSSATATTRRGATSGGIST